MRSQGATLVRNAPHVRSDMRLCRYTTPAPSQGHGARKSKVRVSQKHRTGLAPPLHISQPHVEWQD
eukprot:8095348-Alexandrium_andersonii.AAC.1